MKIVTYRKSDHTVFWIHDSFTPAVIEPVWQEDFAQRMVPPRTAVRWFEEWFRLDGLRVVPTETPADSADIVLWRHKVYTLNAVAAFVSTRRQKFIPPVYGQEHIFHRLHGEAHSLETGTPLMDELTPLMTVNKRQYATALIVEDSQYHRAMLSTEVLRIRFTQRIQSATTADMLTQIMGEMNQELATK